MRFAIVVVLFVVVFGDGDESCWAEGEQEQGTALDGRGWGAESVAGVVEEGEGFAGSSATQAELEVSEDLRADGLVTVAEACSREEGGGGAHGKDCALLLWCSYCHLVTRPVYIIFVGLCTSMR